MLAGFCVTYQFTDQYLKLSKNPESETTIMDLNTSEPPENDKVLKTPNDDDQRRKPVFLFSVDYILNKAGNTNTTKEDTDQQNKQQFDWLYCTRFKPPKLDRIKKKDGQHRQKRRPGRNPRIPFTTQQVTVLENEFRRSAYLGGTNDVHVLSDRLRLSESRIKIWFQNRRARERRDNNSASFSGSSCTNSTGYSSQQQRLPVSSTSAFKPLMPSYTYVEGNDSQS